jgi:hypothetical protein
LAKNEINVYELLDDELLDDFVSLLMALKLSVNSIILYLTAVRSYFGYYDIDVIPSKFKRKVKMPKIYREDEQPIDAKGAATGIKGETYAIQRQDSGAFHEYKG